MMNFDKLERKIYNNTCDLPYFTINDIRRLGMIRYFDSPNQLGWFFMQLSKAGHISSKRAVVAEHKKAKGRYVNAWVWEIEYEDKSK